MTNAVRPHSSDSTARACTRHFGFGVEFRSGLVQNQDRRILQNRAPRWRCAGPLPAAEALSAIRRASSDKPCGRSRIKSCASAALAAASTRSFSGRPGPPIANIVPDGIVEHRIVSCVTNRHLVLARKRSVNPRAHPCRSRRTAPEFTGYNRGRRFHERWSCPRRSIRRWQSLRPASPRRGATTSRKIGVLRIVPETHVVKFHNFARMAVAQAQPGFFPQVPPRDPGTRRTLALHSKRLLELLIEDRFRAPFTGFVRP